MLSPLLAGCCMLAPDFLLVGEVLWTGLVIVGAGKQGKLSAASRGWTSKQEICCHAKS